MQVSWLYIHVELFQFIDQHVTAMLFDFTCSALMMYLCLTMFLQFEPIVHPEAAAHVHHMILYICNDLDAELDQLTPEQLAGGPCYTGAHPALAQCTGQTIIAAWAVGGQVCA